jgi:hypothetical protein
MVVVAAIQANPAATLPLLREHGGSYSDRIKFSGNTWEYLQTQSGTDRVAVKGTWSSSNTVSAPSTGTVSLTATHIYLGSSGKTEPLPASYESDKTNTAKFTLNATGNELVLSESAKSGTLWNNTNGTYIKH